MPCGYWSLEVCVRHLETVKGEAGQQANSRYPCERRRLGTERDSEKAVLREFTQQALRLTSRQNSPGTTGEKAGVSHS